MRVLVATTDAERKGWLVSALAGLAEVVDCVDPSTLAEQADDCEVVVTDDPRAASAIPSSSAAAPGCLLIPRSGPASSAEKQSIVPAHVTLLPLSFAGPNDIERQLFAQVVRIVAENCRLRRQRTVRTPSPDRAALLLEQTGAQWWEFDLPPTANAAIDHWLRQTVAQPGDADPRSRLHPDDHSPLMAALQRFLAQENETFAAEFRVQGERGRWNWQRQQAMAVARHADAAPARVVVTQNDVTRRRRAESLLELQAKIVEQLVSGAHLHDVLTTLLLAIEHTYIGALASVLEYKEQSGRLYHLAGPSLPEEFLRQIDGLRVEENSAPCAMAVHSQQRVVVPDLLADPRCAKYHPLARQYNLRAVWSQPIVGANGKILGTFATYHNEPHTPDEDELRWIEAAANLAGLAIERCHQIKQVRASEDRFKRLTERIRVLPWEYDPQADRVTYIGPQAVEMMGYPLEAWSEPGFWQKLSHPDDLALLAEQAAHPGKYGESYEVECRMRHADGHIVWLHVMVNAVRHEGHVEALRGLSIDITDRKRAEQALRESEERYRILADFSTDLIARHNAEGVCLYVSPACMPLLGYAADGIVGRSVFHFIHPEDRPRLQAAWRKLIDTGVGELVTYRIQRADGKYIWFESLGRVYQPEQQDAREIITTSRDVSLRIEAVQKLRQREAELAHAERLTTMGQMAAELAHELNQPLQAIVSFAEASRARASQSLREKDEKLLEWMDQMARQARRAGDIIRRINQFARKGELDRQKFDLNQCVKELLPLLEVATRNHQADVRYELAAGLPEILADRLLIEQVIINLHRNALESMDETPTAGRRMVVRSFLADDGQVGLLVRDSGRGISAEEEPRLFEPYFTTKSDGTGMGLPICRSTIEAHGGKLWATNNEGGGATFQFVLPVQPE